MKDYELTVLIHPDLEMNLDPALAKVRDLVTTSGGEIVKEDNWGKKKLAYPIDKQEFAVYRFLEVKLPAAAPAKINSVLNITDEVLRYLLVKKDLKKPEKKEGETDESDAKEEK